MYYIVIRRTYLKRSLTKRYFASLSALSKFFSDVLKDKKSMVFSVKNKVGDEYAVVQEQLSVFLNQTHIITNRII